MIVCLVSRIHKGPQRSSLANHYTKTTTSHLRYLGLNSWRWQREDKKEQHDWHPKIPWFIIVLPLFFGKKLYFLSLSPGGSVRPRSRYDLEKTLEDRATKALSEAEKLLSFEGPMTWRLNGKTMGKPSKILLVMVLMGKPMGKPMGKSSDNIGTSPN